MFENPGLYIKIGDKEAIPITEESVSGINLSYACNTLKISKDVKKHPDFGKCQKCPKHLEKGMCHALHPIIPILSITDEYKSHQEVTAYYRSSYDMSLKVVETNFQNVCEYISRISLMSFCGIGKKYWRYYFDIDPLLSNERLISKLYLNIFWLNSGDRIKTILAIEEFRTEITEVAKSQIRRLSLLAKSDVVLNSIVLTQGILQLLSNDLDDSLKQLMDEHEKVNINSPF